MRTDPTILPDGTRLQPGEEIFKMEIKFPPDASGGRGGSVFKLEDGNMLLATGLDAGPLTATKALPDVPMQNGRPFFASEPVGDHLNDDNQPAFASLNAIQNAARVGDYGFCLDAVASGALKGDISLRGVPAWKVGPSANDAANTLARLWAKHVAASTVPQNRKPATRPN